MNGPPKEFEDRNLIDMLIAISVVSRHLARKLEMKGSETNHEPDERPGNDPGRYDTDRESPDRMRRKPDQGSSIHLSQGETAVPRLDDPTSAGLTPFPRQRCYDRQVFSSIFPFQGGAGQGAVFL